MHSYSMQFNIVLFSSFVLALNKNNKHPKKTNIYFLHLRAYITENTHTESAIFNINILQYSTTTISENFWSVHLTNSLSYMLKSTLPLYRYTQLESYQVLIITIIHFQLSRAKFELQNEYNWNTTYWQPLIPAHYSYWRFHKRKKNIQIYRVQPKKIILWVLFLMDVPSMAKTMR